RAVTEARRHLGRPDDVGEHDGPQPGVYRWGGCALGRARGRHTSQETLPRGRARIADAAKERLDGGKIDRNDGVGDFTMRLTMDSLGGRGVRRMDEAEGRTILLVKPIGHVFYSVSVLNVHVPAVRLGDILRLRYAQGAAGHENRHVISLGRRGGWIPL